MHRIEVDMHLHSNFSDGADAPEELVRKAVRAGLKACVLTDHDVYQGLPEFIDMANIYGLDFITGIELTCLHENLFIHLLGYGIDINKTQLLAKNLNNHWEYYDDFIWQKLAQYSKVGILQAELIDVRQYCQAQGPCLFLLNLVAFRTQTNGVSYYQAMQEVSKGGIAGNHDNIRRELIMNLPQAMHFIKSLGGQVVYAHPKVNYDKDQNSFWQVFELMLKNGLFGLEVYNYRHDVEFEKLLIDLATKNNLFITGGSDYHGKNKPGVEFGNSGISYKNFLEIKQALST